MENIRITLETLYDLLRNEKKREDLQKLDSSIYVDIVNYFKEKVSFLEKRKSDKDLFSSGEVDKMEYELRSIRRILKELYEKREKKIIDIAMNKSRTGSEIIDTSSMLPEEKEFYLRTLANLDEFRRGILFNIFKGEIPEIAGLTVQRKLADVGIEAYEDTPSPVNTSSTTQNKLAESTPEPQKPLEVTPESLKTAEPPAPPPEVKRTKIKFTQPVPSFVWKDMKVYGPFSVGDETEIFMEVAELIVRKGRAVKV
jgi:DNA replication initiation complex subunit (GINS family)